MFRVKARLCPKSNGLNEGQNSREQSCLEVITYMGKSEGEGRGEKEKRLASVYRSRKSAYGWEKYTMALNTARLMPECWG